MLNLSLGLGGSKYREVIKAILSVLTPAKPYSGTYPIAGFDNANGAFYLELTDTAPEVSTTGQGVFQYGRPASQTNYYGIQRRTTNNALRLLLTTGGNFTNGFDMAFPSDFIAKNSTMKVAMVWETVGGVYNVYAYLNGVRIAVWTGKTAPILGIGGDVFQINQFNSALTATSVTVTKFEHYAGIQKPRSWWEQKTIVYNIVSATRDPNLGIFINSGQSNNGTNAATGTYSEAGTKLFKITQSGTVATMSDPWDTDGANPVYRFVASSRGEGFAPYALNTVCANTGEKIAALPNYKGGTGSNVEWAGAVVHTVTNAGNPTIVREGAYITIQKGRMANQLGTLKGVIHHQGEYDAINVTSEANFKAQVNAYFDLIKRHLGCHIFYPTLFGWVTGNGATETNWNNVIQWQKDIAAARDDVTSIDFSGIAPSGADPLHANSTDLQAAGALLAPVIEAQCYS